MSTSSDDSVLSLKTEQFVVPLGATNLLLVDGNAVPGANSLMLKMISGGTCEIHGCTMGVTLTAAQGASLYTAGSGYPIDVAERLSVTGPIRFYLLAAGSTAVLKGIWGKSSGT